MTWIALWFMTFWITHLTPLNLKPVIRIRDGHKESMIQNLSIFYSVWIELVMSNQINREYSHSSQSGFDWQLPVIQL